MNLNFETILNYWIFWIGLEIHWNLSFVKIIKESQIKSATFHLIQISSHVFVYHLFIITITLSVLFWIKKFSFIYRVFHSTSPEERHSHKFYAYCTFSFLIIAISYLIRKKIVNLILQIQKIAVQKFRFKMVSNSISQKRGETLLKNDQRL